MPERDLAPTPPPAGGGAAPAARRKPTWGFGDAALGWLIAVVLSQVSLFLVMTLSGETEIDDLSIGLLTLGNTGLWIGFVGWSWFVTDYKGNGPIEDLRLRIRLPDVPIGMLWGIASQYVLVPLVTLPILLLSGKTFEDLAEPAKNFADRAVGPFGVVVLILFTVVAAPICEEIFYRGLVLRSLQRRLGDWPAIVLTGLIFGASHFQLLQLTGLAVFGMVLSVLALRYDRLGPSIVAHMAFNSLAVISTLVAGKG